MAIFEDLDLGEFGGRIPLLTFEVVADEAIGIGGVLRDASGGLIEAGDVRPLPGYAAHGTSIGDSIADLIELCGVQLAERGGKLRSPAVGLPLPITEEELGCDAGDGAKASLEGDRAADKDMPANLAISYYDLARDYQTGQMQASSGRQGFRGERIELPAVLTGEQAKALVEEALARRYRRGNGMRISLPPSRITLRPGDAIQLADTAAWMIRSVTINGLSVEIEAEAAPVAVPTLPADPGRPVAEPDQPVGRTELILFEAPPIGDMLSDHPVVHVAASTDGAWKSVPVELSLGVEPLPSVAMRRQAAVGHALSALGRRAPLIVDEQSSVIVKLADQSNVLLNADIGALMAGANLALLGEELIQFGGAEELEPGIFRLSKLLRGRRGTEWAAGRHRAGEPFCPIGPAVQAVEAPAGSTLTAIAHGVGDSAPLPEVQRVVTGEAMRPPSPCHLKLWRDGSGISAQWVRRSHRGWDWLDEVGVPDDAFAELYRVTIQGPHGHVTFEVTTTSFHRALAELPAISGEMIELTVATVGPLASSHGCTATLVI